MVDVVKKHPGFTLAEFLVALSVLSVIVTFNITKIVTSTTTTKNKALVKEAASAIAGAFQQYQLNNTVTGSTKLEDIFATVNATRLTSGQVDKVPTFSGSIDCADPNEICWLLPTGAVVWTDTGMSFGTLASNQAVLFVVDPDGKTGGFGVGIVLYSNGRLITYGEIINTVWFQGTIYGTSSLNPNPAYNPDWFSWR